MAAMVIPDAGTVLLATWALMSSGVAVEDLVFRLFQNDYTPDDTTTVEDFDEADFTGYSPVTVPRASYTSITAAAGVATAVSTVSVGWTSTESTPQTVYGWFATGADSDTCVAAQRFDIPRVLTTGATELLGPMTWLLGPFS